MVQVTNSAALFDVIIKESSHVQISKELIKEEPIIDLNSLNPLMSQIKLEKSLSPIEYEFPAEVKSSMEEILKDQQEEMKHLKLTNNTNAD